ncbi:SDR family NAD(P)-dependent oxidoreductase [Brachybacterium sp. EF45031]|uniref:SDR family NAD(P)-dependent oxidoreductase n=1 Tax=Brachybacterium sillae TaxID=2810536 RepID=UPI00217D035C|nr:SDR family NAD(P)-dependent oxidoreductase [Brachybacterium sillae]MCS6710568.1 SDR family NAD(P)-dependent oxidoreductase [Brachybacterium sillae]
MSTQRPDTIPVVLVTGATGGLGAAFAEYFASRGWSIVLSARNCEALERFAQKLTADHGARVEVLAADLTTSDGIATLTGYCTTHRVDAVVNNAGAAHTRPFAALPREVIEQEIVLDCCAPGSVQALIPGRMRGYGSTEEVHRGVAGAGHPDGAGGDR